MSSTVRSCRSKQAHSRAPTKSFPRYILDSFNCGRTRSFFSKSPKIGSQVPALYSQVEGVDYFHTFAPTTSTTSNRLVAAVACKIDWYLRPLDVDQAFIQSELDTKIFLRLLPGCGRLSGKVVRLNKALYGLKQSGRSWYELLSSILVECGFEQCLVDP